MTIDFSQITGHERQISVLKRFAERESGSGVFVFSGPEHIGKGTIARHFAAGLLGVKQDDLIRHPDVVLLVPEARENGTRTYDIETVRDALHRVGQSAVLGRTVLLIDDANVLNAQSQNALLKTLEEPIGSTVILLVSHEQTALLPTILSRAVVLPFFGASPEAGEDVQAYARRFASSSSVERLIVAQEVAKAEGIDTDELLRTIVDALREANRDTAHALDAVLTARERLVAHGNSTIVFTELAVQLG